MVTSTKAPKSSASASRKRKAVALVSPNEDAENPETFLVRSRGGAKNASQLLYNNSMSDVSPSSVSSSASTKSNGRPTVSFVEMIHEALEDSDSGMLSLQEIYEAVRERYPYYRSKESVGRETQAWQNSIRHNLSMQACFYKVERPVSRPGKGSLWVSTRSGMPSNSGKSAEDSALKTPAKKKRVLQAKKKKRRRAASFSSSSSSSSSSSESDQEDDDEFDSEIMTEPISSAPSSTLNTPSAPLPAHLIPPVSDKMPPVFRDTQTLGPINNCGPLSFSSSSSSASSAATTTVAPPSLFPQFHSWTGDLWLESSGSSLINGAGFQSHQTHLSGGKEKASRHWFFDLPQALASLHDDDDWSSLMTSSSGSTGPSSSTDAKEEDTTSFFSENSALANSGSLYDLPDVPKLVDLADVLENESRDLLECFY